MRIGEGVSSDAGVVAIERFRILDRGDGPSAVLIRSLANPVRPVVRAAWIRLDVSVGPAARPLAIFKRESLKGG